MWGLASHILPVFSSPLHLRITRGLNQAEPLDCFIHVCTSCRAKIKLNKLDFELRLEVNTTTKLTMLFRSNIFL